MTTTFDSIARRLVAAFCTVIVSATLVAGAVAPAAIPQGDTTITRAIA